MQIPKIIRIALISLSFVGLALLSYHLYFTARYEIVKIGKYGQPVKYDKWDDKIIIPDR